MARSLSEGSGLDTRAEEELEYQCLVTTSSCSSSEPREEMEGGKGELTDAQMEHLMSVIAGMDSVKGAGGGGNGGSNSPPPTDEEIRQFIDYVGRGVVNQERLDFEAGRDQPEPPKRSKTAQQYFWRRHYLSIIQEDEEHDEQTPGSSRPSSRPCSTYENSLAARLSRLGALSPVFQSKDTEARGSWGSEMSVDSLTSINSILSEEGSVTSTGSFHSEPEEVTTRLAPPGLSCLLEMVHPPSCTPDSMAGRSSSCESPTIRPEEQELTQPVKNIKPMGSLFKQQIKQIEEAKQKGKGDGLRLVSRDYGASEAQVPVALPSLHPPPSSRPPPLPTPEVPQAMSWPHLPSFCPSQCINCFLVQMATTRRMEASPPFLPAEEKINLRDQSVEELEEVEVTRNFRAIPSSRLRKPRGRSRGRLMVEE